MIYRIQPERGLLHGRAGRDGADVEAQQCVGVLGGLGPQPVCGAPDSGGVAEIEIGVSRPFVAVCTLLEDDLVGRGFLRCDL